MHYSYYKSLSYLNSVGGAKMLVLFTKMFGSVRAAQESRPKLHGWILNAESNEVWSESITNIQNYLEILDFSVSTLVQRRNVCS